MKELRELNEGITIQIRSCSFTEKIRNFHFYEIQLKLAIVKRKI